MPQVIDLDELADTPSPKRRKLIPIVPKASPSKLSDLLSVFGARKSYTSVSVMDRSPVGGHSLRGATTVSYAESPESSAQSTPRSTSSFDSADQDDMEVIEDDASEDELTSEDTIRAVPRGSVAMQPVLPARSRRGNVDYSRVVPAQVQKEKKTTKRVKGRLLKSDTFPGSETKLRGETARSLVRQDIALHTKPKRDAFLLAHQDFFQPLLPENNYISKLARLQEGDQQADVNYVELSEQPKGIKAVMKPYQLQGLSFLVYMHNNGMSAILGDEMGLGKTLQTLSLFQYLTENKQTSGEYRPNLVVCPLSVLSSWMAEAKKWVPGLNVVRFHGPKTERERIMKESVRRKTASDGNDKSTDRIDLFITTYETFCAEAGWFKRAFVWRYCVLDEGHKIKNDKSDIASALQSLRAEYRLLLTGTPLQNNLKEAWALLHWLFPEVFTLDTGDAFRKAFDLTRGTVSTSFMDDARRLLELIMLRRMKSSPEVNLGLPPKEEVLLYLPLTPMQRFWYTRLLTRADNATLSDLFSGAQDKEAEALKQETNDAQLALLEEAGAALTKAEDVDTTGVWAESKAIMEQAMQSQETDKQSGTWKKLMNLLMQLRKACNHPYLLPGAAPPHYDIGDHVKHASSKFLVLDKLIDELAIKQGKKVLIFSGFTSMLNLCEELFYTKGANTSTGPFKFARLDGGTSRAQRNLSIRLFNNMDSDYKVMLLSTRAGGLGINLTSATDVVFLDEDWNPQVTVQAEARAHRIGQTEKVTIYKLCTSGTVEEQMMGRIRKKLYLSAKITESMRNIHSENTADKKRKRVSSGRAAIDDDAPHLDTASLQSLLRRGAQTLARPEVPVTELLSWDWATTCEKCKDKPLDALEDDHVKGEEIDEQKWLNTMEKVETAVFEGKKHQKELEKKIVEASDLNRAGRRAGKNTTVEIDGFMINKESLNCADWEAVPTFAGKDPRLAEYKKEKKPPIQHQEFCQCCWDGGEIYTCSGCPRAYHSRCLDKGWQAKMKSPLQFHCPQHECRDCGGKTGDVGGMVYRCRWCENGFCEDCLDWDTVKLVGDTLPEFEMRNFGKIAQAYFIECPLCIERMQSDPNDADAIARERSRIQEEYDEYLNDSEESTGPGLAPAAEDTPDTRSEAMTPVSEVELSHAHPVAKKARSSLQTARTVEVIDLDSD
ncbi:Putative helicase, Zinc finger, FYVE/PHD-type, Zinc finger, RING/FYVE/PHD-type [Septoria linicola]|uniref:Helicase, Zinc finger, FYVE/PHD-type, Zinc finger, RING/FYVE/PHD-type n=1 Tax=Septoria linicola TaxID=215465 RepID=A0A9Q9EP78_9PEZI|nr:putative helicase, Zinc finger, FYVE/PHD-type, Zinc finger, RING/FYVE/PHD-type [Septoria linicola]USW57407.1 Putative helicase, Zinc finger, FYVE/PHD-type, Zinc finger, RING/FYVE/PHD-type [Septoria linicola]